MNIRMLKFTAVLFFLSPPAFAANCADPCGPQDLLVCFGNSGAPVTGYADDKSAARSVYNKIFGVSSDMSINNLDGFCGATASVATIATLDDYYANNVCGVQKGIYGSYDDFIDAYTEMAAVNINTTLSFGTLFCKAKAASETQSQVIDERKKELANFFATIAQETTQGVSRDINNLTDGLFYRYEIGNFTGCTSLDTCITQYYSNASENIVAVDGNGKVYTKMYWDNPSLKMNGSTIQGVSANEGDLTQSPMTFTTTPWDINSGTQYAGYRLAPANYQFMKLSDVMKPGYMVGMGPIQLTGNSMMQFFGWYYNNLATPAVEAADLNAFIASYLTDGKLGMKGAFFYWMYRLNGRGYKSVHQILNGNGAVCHDIAAATRFVNGGCGNYDTVAAHPDPTNSNKTIPWSPGRIGYYQYFAGQLGLTLTSTTMAYSTMSFPVTNYTLDSLRCDYKETSALNTTNPLQEYCATQLQ